MLSNLPSQVQFELGLPGPVPQPLTEDAPKTSFFHAQSEVTPLLASAPKTFLTSPFFAAVPQKTEAKRIVRVGEFEYEIGGPVVAASGRKGMIYPALDVRHGELIVASMDFWRPDLGTTQIFFSLNELCRKLNVSRGGAQWSRILSLFQDMSVTAIRRRPVSGLGQDRRFPILKEVAMKGDRITGIALDERFCDAFTAGNQTLDLRLDVLTGMSRAMAKALYFYMPSRAFYHTAKNPFKRTLTNLLEEMGCPPIANRSQRLQRFERGYNGTPSVLAQLAGAATVSGRLQVDVQPTQDGLDHNFMCWMERTPKPCRDDGPGQEAFVAKAPSKLLRAWLDSGKLESEFWSRPPVPLSDYDTEQLGSCGIRIESVAKFLERAKALLPQHVFEARIGDIKAAVLGAGQELTNPPGALIGAMIAAVAGR